MAHAKTEDRICARVPHDVYELLSEAASSIGATINQFLVQSAVEKAHHIVERERVITLSAKAAKTIFDLIENPPEPNERLKKAMQRREEILCMK